MYYKKYELKKETETENYYVEGNVDGEGVKKYIELDTVPLVAKIDLKAKTVLTGDMIEKADSVTQDDIRREEYNIVIMPMDLTTGDYVDIRLMINGQNYIVVSKKEVEVPEISGTQSSDTMWVNLAEGESLYMSDAILSAASVPGAQLYAVKYTEPGIQKAAEPTYHVNNETKKLLELNPNILDQAKETIRRRLESSLDLRKSINDAIGAEENAKENAQTKMTESMTNSIQLRKQYWDALATEAAAQTTAK